MLTSRIQEEKHPQSKHSASSSSTLPQTHHITKQKTQELLNDSFIKPRGPKFFLQADDFIAAYKKYTSKYPKLKDVFMLLEHSFGTYRNDFYRMEDLTIGFLHTVTLSLSATPQTNLRSGQNPHSHVYKHWREVSGNPQNTGLLHSGRIPQDFYDEVTEIAREILNEIPDIPGIEPQDKIFFGGAYGHPLGYDILMDIGKITIPVRHVFYVAEKIIHELIAEKVWDTSYQVPTHLKTEMGGILNINTQQVILEALTMCLGLFEKDNLTDLLDIPAHAPLAIDLGILKKGIEEFVLLEILLAKEDYKSILHILGSRIEKQTIEQTHPKTGKKIKTREIHTIIGRLEDPKYYLFSGHYQLFGMQFFTAHERPIHAWSQKHKEYLCLLNLFHLKKGLKKSEIMNEADIQDCLNSPPKDSIIRSDTIKQQLAMRMGIS